jgi:glycosyltransferase involved in cell wall biosynthesis
MEKGRVSVIIPSRNEQFLPQTLTDVLSKARGDIEVIVVLDGYWPNPPLAQDSRIKTLHYGVAQGMRPAINAAAKMASGEFFLKMDAHVMWDEGYDLKLKNDYHERNWVLTARRYALDPEAWKIDPQNKKYPIDYHYLCEPYERHGDSTPGLHGTAWTERRDARKHIMLDDEMTSQGSGWFMSREHWEQRLAPLEIEKYGVFWHEFQEIGMKTWLGGGAVKVTKNTWYAHLYKGARYGRGYSTRGMGHEEGTNFCTDFWMNDRWPKAVRTMRWFIEKFWPVPTWPADLDTVFHRKPSETVGVKEVTTMGAFKVTAARYGVGDKKNEFVDVTEKVAALATDEGLSIPKVSNELLGCSGAFQGQRKRLTVEYTVDGVPGTGNALERKSLNLPAQEQPTSPA